MTARRQKDSSLGIGAFLLAFACGTTPVSLPALAGTSERLVTERYTGLAIAGHDPVAYFTDGAAVLGVAAVEAASGGAIWRFRNENNRTFFLKNPNVYGPQFGGYDPIAVASGVPFAGKPKLWLIVDQRLYLFGREDNRAAFAADPSTYLREARLRWSKMQNSLAR